MVLFNEQGLLQGLPAMITGLIWAVQRAIQTVGSKWRWRCAKGEKPQDLPLTYQAECDEHPFSLSLV